MAVPVRDEDGLPPGNISIDEPAAEAPAQAERVYAAPRTTCPGTRFLVHSGAFMDYFRGIHGIAHLLLRRCFRTLVQRDWPIPREDWF